MMKKIVLAMTLLSLVVSFTAAQKKKPIKQVQVTAREIVNQPTGKAYKIDLTRKGTIYTLADGIDFSRVNVRTAKGEMTMADLIKKSGKSISGKLRVGMTSDVRTQKLNLTQVGGGGINFSCQNLVCVCTGDIDCQDLFTTGQCGDIAICYEDGCICLRI